MRIRAILTAAGLSGLAAAAFAAAPFGAAHADTGLSGAALPLSGYYQMAVDTAHNYLFFSQGRAGSNSILVTNFNGETVTTITGQTGVMGIALSPDDETLYAALAGAHEVTAISTATRKQTAAYPLGDGNTPFNVAVQSGKLWVSYDTGTAGTAGIGDFDLSAASPALETQAAMGGWASPPMIAADPTDTGNVLVAIEPGTGTAAEAASYDTAADPVTARAGMSTLTDLDSASCVNATDLAVLPGGARFAPACGSPHAQDVYSTADLSAQGSYPAQGFPNSVAFAAGTGLVASGMAAAQPSVNVYRPGTAAPVNQFAPGTSGAGTAGDGLLARGLGLSPNGAFLFAVVGGNGTDRLYQYFEPVLLRTRLTLTAPALKEPLGKTITLSGTLLGPQSSPIAGAAITITSTGPGGKATLKATTDANGAFHVASKPSLPGFYGYDASYDGTASLAPASAGTNVIVPELVPSLSISVTPKTAAYRPTLHITVHLGATKTNRTVYIYAQPAGSTRQVLLKTATVGSTGTVTLTYRAMYSTTFRAEFSGDSVYKNKTVTAIAGVAAAVTLKTGGYYASKTISSVTYRLYHRAKKLLAAVLVAPNKHGECVKFDLQELYKGKWYDSLTGCGTLAAHSTVGAIYTLSRADLGYHYRLRAEYQRGKDTSNLSADSGWQYFIVQK